MYKANIITIFLILLLGSLPINSFGQKFYVQASSLEIPENYTVDITFTVENGDLNKFYSPKFNDFDVYGPSQSQNISIINGRVSKSFSYTYTLQPKKQGEFIIDEATATINGKQYKTTKLKIKVGPPQSKPKQKRQQQYYDPFEDFFGGGSTVQRPSDEEIRKDIGDNIFVKVIPNKTSLYEGDQVTLSYKLYFRLRYDGLNATKVPSYNGFLSEEFDLPEPTSEPEIETYNGKKYYAYEFKRVALFPQNSGKKTIDPMEFSCVVGVEIPNPYNPFFSDVEPFDYNFKSNAVNLEVLPLPQPQPKNFSGAVGKFNFQASYDKTQVKVGEPIKLKITYNGTGNLRLISAPKLTFPEEFEAYEPKLNENYTTKGAIVSGTKSFEYILIPQDGGKYKLPEYEFGYFDLDKKNYVTFKLPETEIDVSGKAQVSKNLVEFIKREKKEKSFQGLKGNVQTLADNSTLFGSTTFWSLSGLPFLLFIVGFLLRKRDYSSAELLSLKRKKANKMALRRLKVAKKLMNKGQEKEFYDEVIRALLHYTSDKLHIPVSELSKDNIASKLVNSKISDQKVQLLTSTLEDCEMALFASINKSAAMETTFKNAIEWIVEVDDELGKLS